jgi:hypothetical protein
MMRRSTRDGSRRYAAAGPGRAFARVVSFLLAILAATGCTSEPAPAQSIEALVDSLLPAVQRVAALQATGPVKVGIKTPADVLDYVVQKLDTEFPPAELEGSRLAYTLLGLLPADLDLHKLLLDLYKEQIAGFYDPETKTLYAVDGVATAALKPVLAHELVHALQDQHVNLDSLISGRRGNDRQTAAQSAIEGHATIAMLAWTAEQFTGAPVDVGKIPDIATAMAATFNAQAAQFPVLAGAPRIIRDELIFPYASGASFVQALWRRPGLPPEAPFGALMPQSTEQVMDPQGRFIASRDVPTEIRYEDVSGWTIRYRETMGAFETRIFLEEHGGSAVAGWDGDRILLLEADGATGLVWTSIWDDATSADTFDRAVRGIIARPDFGRPGDVERMDVENRPVVRVRIADDAALLARMPKPAVHCVTESGSPTPCASTTSR